MAHDVVILGIFVADTSYRAERQPKIGETILGRSFVLGPGGKGSNQAVSAARSGGKTAMFTKLGKDVFADMALEIWREAGVSSLATQHSDQATGAAYIFVEDGTGNNAIIVSPGVAATITPADVDAVADEIRGAKVFVTQLEQPMDAAQRGLEIARAAGVKTILNPAPAAEIPDEMLALCDYITPNETEAGDLAGVKVTDRESAVAAAKILIGRGVGTVIVTLGENGALCFDGETEIHVPGMSAGPVAETTGAGDAFNGAFATALAGGRDVAAALRFANAAAAISVTRPGTAPSMASRDEIEALLKKVN